MVFSLIPMWDAAGIYGTGNGKSITMEQQTTAGKGVSDAPYMVAGWSVDPATLRIRNHDKEVKLEPKAMAVLEYLAARPGQVVSRQDLEDAVWTNTVVGYDAISNAIIKLRKAFNDQAQNSRIIETIPKTGYRLIATVELFTPDLDGDERGGENRQTEHVDAHRTETGGGLEISSRGIHVAVKIFLPLGFLILVASLWFRPAEQIVEPASKERMAFPLPDKPSIAVLPFSNLSDDKQQNYFADGMTDDLITDISKISGVFVVSRNSVEKYKGKTVEIRQVAEELGVRYVMEGSVRRVGNDVRINAQLIDALTGGHKWAERYDGSLDNVLTMQDKIIASIVDELEIKLIGEEQANLTEIKTSHTGAYDAYLRGWERYRQGTPEDFAKAISFFEQAIELDPNYAQAYSALAAVDWGVNFNGWARTIGITPYLARERSRKSLHKAMQHPSALTYRISSERSALIYRKPDKALAEAERAIALNANDPAGHLAMAAALLKAGKPDEAANSVRTAIRHDPNYPAYYLNRLAQAQYEMSKYQDAIETLETAAKRNPDDDWTFVYLAATYGQLGDEKMAKEALKTANELRAKAGWGELILEIVQDFANKKQRYIFKWFGNKRSLRDGLRKAGVPNGNEWRNLVTLEDTGAEVKGAEPISSNTAKMLYERGVPFIDIFYHWDQKRIPDSHYLEIWSYDFNEISLSKIVNKNQEVVIYTSGGHRDRWLPDAAALAVTWGYEKVYYYPDGLRGWEKAGYPLDNEKMDVL